MGGSSETKILQELILYAASAALSCLVLFAGLRHLDPNREAAKKALEHKKEIAKREVVTSCAAMKDRRPVTVAFNQNRRVQRRRQAIHVLPDEVALRVVCHASVIGGIIGANGSVISKLRRDTGIKIHCEAPENDSDHGIVFIVGSTTINKSILLTDRFGDFSGGEHQDWVTCKVSAAQAALIRVLERSWMVLADKDNNGGDGGDEEAYCGILANQTQIGAVMGKRGKNVESMRRESGAMIRVLPQPTCSTNNDELIQITGGILPVKKALVMVSGVLQNCPPLNGYPPPLCSKAYDSSTHGNSEDPHSEFFPNPRSLLPPLSSENASEAASIRHLSSVDVEGKSYHDSKNTERKVVFRMICTNVAAGGIIGKNGTVIRALQNETGAAISFNTPLKHGERIVTISAFENLESRYSAAQNALLLVFIRTVEIDIGRRRLHDGATVKALLLVPSQFANGFITNNNEEIIAIGVEVHVSVGDQIMDCISNNESIIEIKGEYKQVEKALSHIAFKLRDTLLPKEFLDEIRARVSNPYEVAGPSHISNPQPLQQNATRGDSLSISDSELDLNMVRTGTDLMKSINYLMHTDVLKDVEELKGGNASLPSLQDNDSTEGTRQLQLASSLDIFSLPQRSKGISLKNHTLELAIEKDALVTLYGRNGAGLDNLQQISGAKVVVGNNPTGSETMVVISGTCEQTRAAISLIVSILADQ